MALYIAHDDYEGGNPHLKLSAYTAKPEYDREVREWDGQFSCIVDAAFCRALGVPLPKPGKCVKVPKIDKSKLEVM